VPDDLKALYATAFEIDALLARRSRSAPPEMDRPGPVAQPLHRRPNGRKLDALYRLAWERGLKTTYYLRSRSATHVEKSTLKGTDGKLNAVSSVLGGMVSAPKPVADIPFVIEAAKACSIDDPTCEACQ
jgi:ribonucleoside-diphosphate reductase alpha chain